MIVYHFLSALNALDDLQHKRIRISRVRDLNDPFELLAMRTDYKQLRQSFFNWRNQVDRDHGLLCFSRTFHHTVLWSHYADKHRGICLAFNIADDFARPVEYIKERLAIDGAALTGQSLKGEFVQKLLFSKYIHWQYEDEVRAYFSLDHHTRDNDNYFYDFGDQLQLIEVITGIHCPIPMAELRAVVRGNYPCALTVKARPAMKFFSIVRETQSAKEENEYWASVGKPEVRYKITNRVERA